MQNQYTHEQYIQDVRRIALSHVARQQDKLSPEDMEAIDQALQNTKLVYGIGEQRTRGRTLFAGWQGADKNVEHVCEVCASCESSPLQLAGTTIHELAHVLAPSSGHNDVWKEATELLGLRGAKAGGTEYTAETFCTEVYEAIKALPAMTDGQAIILGLSKLDPAARAAALARASTCSAGIGTRGGKSRGIGSGSRLRKYVCSCGQIIRASTDSLDAQHNECGTPFKRAE